MELKKSTNINEPSSSITYNINNAGVVGDSYTPTTFNNMFAGEKITENIPDELVEESGDEYVEDDNSDHIPSDLTINYHP